jgi:hypothetical protein
VVTPDPNLAGRKHRRIQSRLPLPLRNVPCTTGLTSTYTPANGFGVFLNQPLLFWHERGERGEVAQAVGTASAERRRGGGGGEVEEERRERRQKGEDRRRKMPSVSAVHRWMSLCVFTVGRVRGKKAMAAGEAAFEIQQASKPARIAVSSSHAAHLARSHIVLTVCGVGFENASL